MAKRILILTAENKYIAMSRAKFYYTVIPELKAVFLRDLDGKVSVTNDAEYVTREITRNHLGYRLFYKDTNNCWDELLYDNKGYFTGYGFLVDEEKDFYKDHLT